MSRAGERIQVAVDLFKAYENTPRRDELLAHLHSVVGAVRAEYDRRKA